MKFFIVALLLSSSVLGIVVKTQPMSTVTATPGLINSNKLTVGPVTPLKGAVNRPVNFPFFF